VHQVVILGIQQDDPEMLLVIIRDQSLLEGGSSTGPSSTTSAPKRTTRQDGPEIRSRPSGRRDPIDHIRELAHVSVESDFPCYGVAK
jgi:hypothetical protein